MGAKHISEFLKDDNGSDDFQYIESAFRRGFLHGYDKGMDNLRDLILEDLTLQEAYNLQVQFYNEVITPWRETNRDRRIEPPSFEEWRASRTSREKEE